MEIDQDDYELINREDFGDELKSNKAPNPKEYKTTKASRLFSVLFLVTSLYTAIYNPRNYSIGITFLILTIICHSLSCLRRTLETDPTSSFIRVSNIFMATLGVFLEAYSGSCFTPPIWSFLMILIHDSPSKTKVAKSTLLLSFLFFTTSPYDALRIPNRDWHEGHVFIISAVMFYVLAWIGRALNFSRVYEVCAITLGVFCQSRGGYHFVPPVGWKILKTLRGQTVAIAVIICIVEVYDDFMHPELHPEPDYVFV